MLESARSFLATSVFNTGCLDLTACVMPTCTCHCALGRNLSTDQVLTLPCPSLSKLPVVMIQGMALQGNCMLHWKGAVDWTLCPVVLAITCARLLHLPIAWPSNSTFLTQMLAVVLTLQNMSLLGPDQDFIWLVSIQ